MTNLQNNLTESIKFTLQKEVNNNINFLDILVIKHNRIKFDIYRQPTITDTTIQK